MPSDEDYRAIKEAREQGFFDKLREAMGKAVTPEQDEAYWEKRLESNEP
jgi:hypothetical protein